jgi:anthranilate synthase/aminodeoxychorismate synthase-like glutamine amidotransferase
LRVLVIDNYDSITFNLVQYLGELGATSVVVKNDAIDVAGIAKHAPDGVLVSPGPCTPNDAGISLAAVMGASAPVLGVCLGHQLLADALGGTCGPQRPPEVGILDIEVTEAGKSDPVFAGLPHRMKALQWHGVKVAQAPDDAVVLARSDVCSVQAMRIGRHAYSMQYHVEIEPTTITDWGKIPAYEAALAKVRGPNALAGLAKEAEPLMQGFVANARRLYRNFMAVTAPMPAK